jgi:Cu(I)/Ag(I) efflux system membrane fusion protein
MNNRTQWLAAAMAAVVIAGIAGYALGHRSGGSPAKDSQPPAAGERKILYWHDPMVPAARFDKPGKSPYMDMQLVPVYADEADSSGAVRINANVTQSLGIRLGKVEKRVLSQRLDAVGTVGFDERLLEVVQARVNGYVTRLYVKTPLERVKRGQPLAEILSPEWLAAQQDYLALLDSTAASAQPIREAARQRLVVLGVPEATIQAVEKDRKTNATATVLSPIDGVVTELAVRDGAAFMAGGPLFRINGLATVWVNAQIPEARVSLVVPGSDVEVHATAWPGASFHGRVGELLPDVSSQTRTASARVVIDNPQRQLLPGMFVSLSFGAASAEPQLVVPSEAVIVTGQRSVVVVAGEGGTFDVREVQVGAESNGISTILAGLQEGQSIVLSGQFLIDSEASLKSTFDRLGNSPSEQARP